VLLDFPLLAEVIEEMMLPQYHLISNNKAWSQEALSFLSCSLLDLVETLMKVGINIKLLTENKLWLMDVSIPSWSLQKRLVRLYRA